MEAFRMIEIVNFTVKDGPAFHTLRERLDQIEERRKQDRAGHFLQRHGVFLVSACYSRQRGLTMMITSPRLPKASLSKAGKVSSGTILTTATFVFGR